MMTQEDEDRILQAGRIYEQQKGDCAACEKHFWLKEMTRHHIIPKSAGGVDDDANVCMLCLPCHELMHGKTNHAWHRVMRRILVAKGFTTAERAKVYATYVYLHRRYANKWVGIRRKR